MTNKRAAAECADDKIEGHRFCGDILLPLSAQTVVASMPHCRDVDLISFFYFGFFWK